MPSQKNKKKTERDRQETYALSRKQTKLGRGDPNKQREGGKEGGIFTLHPQKTHWGCPWPFGMTVYWRSVQGAPRPDLGPGEPRVVPGWKGVVASGAWEGCREVGAREGRKTAGCGGCARCEPWSGGYAGWRARSTHWPLAPAECCCGWCGRIRCHYRRTWIPRPWALGPSVSRYHSGLNRCCGFLHKE